MRFSSFWSLLSAHIPHMVIDISPPLLYILEDMYSIYLPFYSIFPLFILTSTPSLTPPRPLYIHSNPSYGTATTRTAAQLIQIEFIEWNFHLKFSITHRFSSKRFYSSFFPQFCSVLYGDIIFWLL